MVRFEVPTLFFNILDFDDEPVVKCPKRARVGKRHCRQSAFKPYSLNKWFETIDKQQQEAHEEKKSKAESKSTIKSDVFAHNFDVQPFEPSEISVKMDGDTLVVSGKHEHTSDDGQYELREYVRKVKVPENVLADQMKCKLDAAGQLQIEAPLRKPEEDKPAERTIPIEFVKKSDTESEQQQDMALD